VTVFCDVRVLLRVETLEQAHNGSSQE